MMQNENFSKRLLKVMLVDDESIILDYLRTVIDWEKEGFQVADVETSSEKALESFSELLPDIVITDIRMPNIDGIFLSRKMREIKKNVKIILLTAYSDFTYAQDAIDINVTGYLLKHKLTKETLLNELCKAGKALGRENGTLGLARRYILRNIFEGRGDLVQNADADTASIFSALKGNCQLLLLGEDVPYPLLETSEDPVPRQNRTLFLLEKQRQEFPGLVEYMEIDWRYTVVLFSFSKQQQLRSSMEQTARKIQAYIRANGNMTVSIAIQSNCGGTLQLPECLRRASQLMRQAVFSGRESLLLEGRQGVQQMSEPIFSEHQAETLLTEDPEQFKKELFRAFRQIKENRDPDAIRSLVTNALHGISKFSSTYGVPQLAALLEDGEMNPPLLYSASEIRDYLVQYVDYVTTATLGKNMSCFSRRVRSSIHIITSRYRERLTVEDIAGELEVSAVYIRRLFKSETGCTIHEFLEDYRMEQAKRLLKTGKYKVYEVAEMTGYENAQYFSTAFKRKTGQYPKNY